MISTHNASRHRLTLLLLACLSLLIIIGLGVHFTNRDFSPSFLTLQSKSFVLGRPISLIRLGAIERLLYAVLPQTHQLEKMAINRTYFQKGLIAQAYQQSPYSLALITLQLATRESQENSINAAFKLTPKNHPLQTILTQLKLR